MCSINVVRRVTPSLGLIGLTVGFALFALDLVGMLRWINHEISHGLLTVVIALSVEALSTLVFVGSARYYRRREDYYGYLSASCCVVVAGLTTIPWIMVFISLS